LPTPPHTHCQVTPAQTYGRAEEEAEEEEKELLERELTRRVRGTVEQLPSGGASRRTSLRNDETESRTPFRSDPVPGGEAPMMTQGRARAEMFGRGAGIGAGRGDVTTDCSPPVLLRSLLKLSSSSGPQGGASHPVVVATLRQPPLPGVSPQTDRVNTLHTRGGGGGGGEGVYLRSTTRKRGGERRLMTGLNAIQKSAVESGSVSA